MNQELLHFIHLTEIFLSHTYFTYVCILEWPLFLESLQISLRLNYVWGVLNKILILS